jgi:hypothetical protein
MSAWTQAVVRADGIFKLAKLPRTLAELVICGRRAMGELAPRRSAAAFAQHRGFAGPPVFIRFREWTSAAEVMIRAVGDRRSVGFRPRRGLFAGDRSGVLLGCGSRIVQPMILEVGHGPLTTAGIWTLGAAITAADAVGVQVWLVATRLSARRLLVRRLEGRPVLRSVEDALAGCGAASLRASFAGTG